MPEELLQSDGRSSSPVFGAIAGEAMNASGGATKVHAHRPGIEGAERQHGLVHSRLSSGSVVSRRRHVWLVAVDGAVANRISPPEAVSEAAYRVRCEDFPQFAREHGLMFG